MTRAARCITCGTERSLEPVGGTYGCPAHIRGLRGRADDILADLAWLQATRAVRMRARIL